MIKREEMSEKEIRDWYVSRHGLDANDDGTKDYYVHAEFLKAWDEKRIRGKWEKGESEKITFFTRVCAECGEKSAVGNFCMWCGADMMPREGEPDGEHQN